jgi:hypothetical protein
MCIYHCSLPLSLRLCELKAALNANMMPSAPPFSALFVLSDGHQSLLDMLEKTSHFSHSKQIFVRFLNQSGTSFCIERLVWETSNVAILYFYFFSTPASLRLRFVHDMQARIRALDLIMCTKPLRSLLVRYDLAHESLAAHFPHVHSSNEVRSGEENNTTSSTGSSSTATPSSRPRSVSRTLQTSKLHLSTLNPPR